MLYTSPSLWQCHLLFSRKIPLSLLPSKPENMNSTGNSKKRKIWCGEAEEEEDDEIKMEKFFALVRSIRESREGLRRFGETENGSSKVKNNRVGVWKPQFQIEDFMEVDPHHQNRSQKYNPPLDFSSADLPRGSQKAADEKKEAERGMNLSLSL